MSSTDSIMRQAAGVVTGHDRPDKTLVSNVTPRKKAGNVAAARGQAASIYVHFPWCLAKCPYCDFVSYAAERKDIDHAGYAAAVMREADGRARQLAGRDL